MLYPSENLTVQHDRRVIFSPVRRSRNTPDMSYNITDMLRPVSGRGPSGPSRGRTRSVGRQHLNVVLSQRRPLMYPSFRLEAIAGHHAETSVVLRGTREYWVCIPLLETRMQDVHRPRLKRFRVACFLPVTHGIVSAAMPSTVWESAFTIPWVYTVRLGMCALASCTYVP